MSKNLKKLVTVVLSAALLAGMIPNSAFAASTKANLQQTKTVNSVNLNSEIKNPITISKLKVNQGVQIKKSSLKHAKNLSSSKSVSSKVMAPAATTSSTPLVYNVSGSILGNTTTLNSTNDVNYYAFSVSTDRYMALGLSSSNTNYYVQLYQYQSSTGNYAATNVVFPATNTYELSDLPAGNYLLDVFSKGTVGDNYTIVMNASNPANPTKPYINSFTFMVCEYSSTNSIYVNGYQLTQNGAEIGTDLDWKRNYDSVYGEYDQGIDQIIDMVKIDNSSTFYHATYHTADSYANSDNALLIPISYGSNGTNYTFQHILLQNGKIVYQIGPTSGNTLQNTDWLVYDLSTNKVIDFYGDDNYLYEHGYISQPTVNIIQ